MQVYSRARGSVQREKAKNHHHKGLSTAGFVTSSKVKDDFISLSNRVILNGKCQGNHTGHSVMQRKSILALKESLFKGKKMKVVLKIQAALMNCGLPISK